MPEINILSPHVADMIAAGEVVERPASVIKELVENSFDAGAHNITVEIRGGGATYIRVTDDGCGMTPEDAGIAFLRHATSKLHDEKGLESIGTMGFRGEALAAISAVSHIELTTRRRGSIEGTRVTLTAGDIQEMTPCGCPEGTTMVVRDIFFNTPARLKFLKSDRSESSACGLTALRCALGHPECSVRFIRDGKEEFFSPGDDRQDSTIYTLLGREMANSMLSVTGTDEKCAVTGFVSSPANGRGNRAQQYFFCNGRFIKSQLLQAAVEQAYKNTLLTGRYPACVLYITLPFGQVDVNVHPAKTEVKFSDEKRVFDLVHYAVLSALGGEDRTTAAVGISESTKKAADIKQTPVNTVKTEPKKDFYRSMTSESFRQSGYSVRSSNSAPKSGYTMQTSASKSAVTPPAPKRYTGNLTLHSPEPVMHNSYDIPVQTALDLTARHNSTEISLKPAVKPANENIYVEKTVESVEKSVIPDHKIVGEALKTYIIVEVNDELILIDKHAAHERMNFDRLKAQGHSIMAQNLLMPVTMRLSGEDCELLEQNGELLTELGFEIEPYGETEYIVRAVPADMASADVTAAVEEICEKLRGGRGLDPQSVRDEVLHTVACKAAIKAGWNTEKEELETIAKEVLSGRIKYCPHGRPVSMVVTRKDLDKLFKRIV